jgi:hypothetical protein
MSKLSGLVIALGLAAVATGVYMWWQQQHPVLPPTPAQPPIVAEAPAAPAEPAAPEIKYPIDAVKPDAPAADSNDVGQAVTALVGRDAVLKFMQLADFPHRVVATLDGLGRPYVSPVVWTVNPTPGRFTVQGPSDNQVIAAANNVRYQPFVAMVRSLDAGKLVALYVKMYPQLQQSYQDLGYSHGYFNDRVVDVLDNLLATPEPADPIAVTLTQVKGELQPKRPWLRYEYGDAELEAASAGQRIMLRMGAANRTALKAKLADIRKLVTAGAVPAQTAN